MTTYYNPTTKQTAKVNSTQADENDNVWVEIGGGEPKMVNWETFLKEFNSIICGVKIQNRSN